MSLAHWVAWRTRPAAVRAIAGVGAVGVQARPCGAEAQIGQSWSWLGIDSDASARVWTARVCRGVHGCLRGLPSSGSAGLRCARSVARCSSDARVVPRRRGWRVVRRAIAEVFASSLAWAGAVNPKARRRGGATLARASRRRFTSGRCTDANTRPDHGIEPSDDRRKSFGGNPVRWADRTLAQIHTAGAQWILPETIRHEQRSLAGAPNAPAYLPTGGNGPTRTRGPQRRDPSAQCPWPDGHHVR